MKTNKRNVTKTILLIACLGIVIFLNITNVYAGERSMWDMWRPIYGWGTEISHGEPSVYQSNESGIDHYTYGYGGFWSGNDYYYSKTVLYDTYSSRNYNDNYYYHIDVSGRTAYSGSSVYPDAGLDPDRVYLQVSTDNSTYRTIGISESFRTATNSVSEDKHYIANLSNATVGTWRYVRAKFPASNKRPSWMTTQDRSATIDGFLFGLRQVDNIAPYGNAPTISNVTSDSFDVTVTGVGDSISSVSSVKFATWTTANGKDDIQWYSGTNLGNGTWKYTVNREDHGGVWGEYTVNAYAYDEEWAGNNKFLGEVKVNLRDIDAPTLTLSQNTTTWTKGTVTITASASDIHSGIKNIKLPDGSFVDGSSANYTALTNGAYTFVAYDNFGNSKSETISITNIDKTPPSISFTLTPTAWTTGSVQIKAYASDIALTSGVKQIQNPDGTIINGASTTYTVSANGTYSFTATDKAGNVATKSVTVSNIDTGNPSISIATNQNWTNASSVAVTLSSSDTQSGVASTQYSLSGATALGFTDYSAPFNIVNEGQTTITAKATDGVGHTAQTTATVKIDRTKPSATFTQSTTAWTSGSVTITANAKDGLSGVKQIKKPDGTIINGASTTYSVSANGTYSFEITDNAGNVEVETITISNIDKTAPVVTITQTPTTWTNGNVVLNISSTDSGAGVKDIKVPNGSIVEGSTTSYTVSANGTYTFEVTDNVGNKATKSITVSNIDKTAPGVTITPDTTVWTNGDVTLMINASDEANGSGVKSITLPDGTIVTGSSTSFVVSINGTYTLSVIDNAGNKTTKSIAISNIDETAPGVTITPSTTAWTNGNVILSISSTDSGSGVKDIKLPNGSIVSGSTTSYTVSANGTYVFEVTDNVGNKTTKSVSITNIDKTLPEAVITQTPTAWTNGNVTLNISATDGGSNIKDIKKPDGVIVSGSSASYTVSANGTYAFEISDVAGNKVTKSITVNNIDKVIPVIAVMKDNDNFTTADINLTINVSDVGSGVKDIKLPNGNIVSSSTASYKVSENGSYTFEATDNAGNKTVYNYVVGNIDREPPVLELTIPNRFTNNTIVITVKATDSVSGVNSIKLPDNNWVTTPTTTYSVSENGVYYFSAKDNLGNEITKYIVVDKIDRNNPTVKIINTQEWINQNVPITIEATDS